MALMEMNFNISPRSLLIGVVGIIIGCISAFSFAVLGFLSSPHPSPVNIGILQFLGLFFRFGPGFVFGLAVAVIYFIKSEQRQGKRVVGATVIMVTGVVCYQIAFWLTFFITLFAHDAALIVAPIIAAIGGFVATYIFVDILQAITDNKYPIARGMFGIYGGLLGAILIDSITYVMNPDVIDINTQGPDSSTIFLSSCIFFIGWQTIMLLIISGPLVKKTGDQITTPAPGAGPVNVAVPR